MVIAIKVSATLRGSRGFALVDAIVAAVILGIALAIILGLASEAISAQSRGERIETAARLADERLNLVLATGTKGYEAAFKSQGACESPFEEYRYFVEITPNGPGEASLVRATITWDAGAMPQSLTLETRIAPRLGDDPNPDRRPLQTIDRNAQ